MSTGFSFGNTAAGQSTTGGFGATSGFNFGQTANKNAGASTGLGGSFGAPAAGFGAVGAAGTANPTTSTATLGGGFNFGGASTAATGTAQPTTTATGGLSGLGGFGGTAAKTPATGFGATTGLAGFGATSTPSLATTTTATPGFSLGGGLGATATAKPGLTLGGFGATATTAPTAATTASTGFGFGGGLGSTATAKPGLTLGGFGATAPTAGFSAGPGIGGTTSSLGSSVFAATATTTASKGLGGVDPKTTTATTGISGTNGKPGDSKAVKETAMPNEITITVEDFKKYVKEQRSVREEIDRMSSKPMFKVQEEVASLKQWLSLVSTGLQRNAMAIDKLKQESAQELKNAEIAQRTKDLPAGLQYENTAPSEYFARMLDDFESRMVLYRQQIEEMESHLASLQQPSMLTPLELSMLLKKIYESFIHLAAQLQVIHEAVKAQKKQYLNYRKVFHGDSTDIFEKRRKAVEKARTGRPEKIVGPTPFTGMSNAAAMAMATALNRAQQPTGGAPTLGLNTGLGTSGLTGQTGGLGTGLGAGSIFGNTGTGTAPGAFGSTGFGSTTQPQQTGFGSTSFNFGAPNTATVRPLGSTFGSTGSNTATGLFGSTATGTGGAATGGFGFGAGQTAGGFASQANTAGALNLSTTGTFGAAPQDNKQPFLLQKPPAGNKKGKKT